MIESQLISENGQKDLVKAESDSTSVDCNKKYKYKIKNKYKNNNIRFLVV